MPGQPFVAGPAFLTAAAANVAGVNPAANTYRLIRHIHVHNKNAATRVLTLYKGLTGGSASGTELTTQTVQPNSSADLYWPSGDKYTTADFLSGLSSTDATSLVIEVMGEIYAS